jgi:hypothetical protein
VVASCVFIILPSTRKICLLRVECLKECYKPEDMDSTTCQRQLLVWLCQDRAICAPALAASNLKADFL